MDPNIRKQFEHLALQRSPENLSCDGMLSRRQIQSRHNSIMREWNALERKVGHKVSLSAVEDGMCEPDYPPYYMLGRGGDAGGPEPRRN